jgi:hypothetical protein
VLRNDRAPVADLAQRSGKIKFGTPANRQTKPSLVVLGP